MPVNNLHRLSWDIRELALDAVVPRLRALVFVLMFVSEHCPLLKVQAVLAHTNYCTFFRTNTFL